MYARACARACVCHASIANIRERKGGKGDGGWHVGKEFGTEAGCMRQGGMAGRNLNGDNIWRHLALAINGEIWP